MFDVVDRIGLEYYHRHVSAQTACKWLTMCLLWDRIAANIGTFVGKAPKGLQIFKLIEQTGLKTHQCVTITTSVDTYTCSDTCTHYGFVLRSLTKERLIFNYSDNSQPDSVVLGGSNKSSTVKDQESCVRRIFILESLMSNTDPADVLLPVLLVLVIRSLHLDGDQVTSTPHWPRDSPLLPLVLRHIRAGLRGQSAQGHHQGRHQVIAQQDLGGIHLK